MSEQINYFLKKELTSEKSEKTLYSYYPFGMPMPNRQYSLSSSKYRFGFNGKENDNEIYGQPNSQDYGMRYYDVRIGRFFSVDPITSKYPELTPYQFASNTPIQAIDLDGLEAFFVHGTKSGPSMWTPLLTNSLWRNITTARGYEKLPAFSWEKWSKSLLNNEEDRNHAALELAKYIQNYRTSNGISDNEPITLISHSHGGNVSIQAVEYLRQIYHNVPITIINFNTPAYNGEDDFENPANIKETNVKLVHFWTNNDKVAGTAGNDKYSSSNIVNSNMQIKQIELKNSNGSWGLGGHYMNNVNLSEIKEAAGSVIEFIKGIFSGGDETPDNYILNPRF